MSDDTSPDCFLSTSSKRKPIGVITTSSRFWLVTPNWYMRGTTKVGGPEKCLVTESMWDIWGKLPKKPTVKEIIYDETELLRWIIRGNPNK